MQNDRTTLKDLSVFTSDGNGIFAMIDHTVTQAGKDMLVKMLYAPPANYEALKETQDVIKFWTEHADDWPAIISNGTMVMLEKFFESADNTTTPPTGISLALGSFAQKIFNKNEYFFTRFSVSHIADFLNGCIKLTDLLERKGLPALLVRELELMKGELQHRLTPEVIKVDKITPYKEITSISYKTRREMKHTVYRLMNHYARLDAWQSMAQATVQHKWIFPELQATHPVHLEAKGLYHPLLQKPVAYDIGFSAQRNFLLLTGANMSGKTTFMRAIGVATLLGHLGMGVPAASMRMSFLQGVITNMHVEDDLIRGESYFLAEVKRMKHTAEKLVQSQPHLVLMDELFKGTNVHDAYECTRAVIEGLLKRPNHLMILSTHLYEVAQNFTERTDIQLAYFITKMTSDSSFQFTYELKEGVSNDRIGYRILQKEGVLELLNRPG